MRRVDEGNFVIEATAIKVPVKARVRLPDGREFDLLSQTDADTQPCYGDPPYTGHVFWWVEGNQSCDCNRSLDLNRQHGLALGAPDDCLPCGDTITLLSLEIDGKERLS